MLLCLEGYRSKFIGYFAAKLHSNTTERQTLIKRNLKYETETEKKSATFWQKFKLSKNPRYK